MCVFCFSIKNINFALNTTHIIILTMTSLSNHLEGEDFGDQILSKSIKAGRGGDYFLTITESRKVSKADGSFSFDRHKIFLYKEDFEKFTEGLNEVLDFIKAHQAENDE